MVLLAIEMSAQTGSVAVLGANGVLSRSSWDRTALSPSALFPELNRAASAAGLGWEEVDLFITGRGPGNYSGLRMAATAVQALALPGRGQAGGVNSAEALAGELAAETGREHVLVIGDARRGRLWWGLLAPGRPFECTLAAAQNLAGLVPDDVLIGSPDAERLSGVLQALRGPRRTPIMEARVPTAAAVGRLAWERLHAGRDLEPATPIYLHPAVAVSL